MLFIDSTAIAKGYSCVSQPFFIARLALWNTVGLPGGFITFLWVCFIPKLEAPAIPGLSLFSVQAGRGAYAIRALPDLCLGIVSGCLEFVL